ncbi:MAG: hypothetical protein AB7S38_15890 [Vulcanimicrobiota bacterium]
MNDHERIDAWSLAMMTEIVARIDADPERRGLEKARVTLQRWHENGANRATTEWLALLELPWDKLRVRLLDEGDEGQRLRSSAPFCGVLDPRERLEIFREFRATRPA